MEIFERQSSLGMLPKQKDKLEKIKNDLKENTIKELDLWGNEFFSSHLFLNT